MAKPGFSLERSAQGKGWARAAVQACITWLLVPLNVVRVRGITDERNASSRRLLQHLGFVETGREQVMVRGEACTDLIMELRCGA